MKTVRFSPDVKDSKPRKGKYNIKSTNKKTFISVKQMRDYQNEMRRERLLLRSIEKMSIKSELCSDE